MVIASFSFLAIGYLRSVVMRRSATELAAVAITRASDSLSEKGTYELLNDRWSVFGRGPCLTATSLQLQRCRGLIETVVPPV